MKRKHQPLPEPELRAILRAADEIIAQGGRTLLSKILKGSKERKVIELGLEKNPAYGFYKELSLGLILDKVDQVINTGYLEIEVNGRLPLLVFSPLGWAIERERRAEELLREWDNWLDNKIVPISMEYLKERNRGMMFLFIYKIIGTRNKKYIPFLTQWEQIEFKKVQAEIRNAIEMLKQSDGLDEAEWAGLLKELAKTLLIRSRDPILLKCDKCRNLIIFDEMSPEYYTSEGLKLPNMCINCLEAGPLNR